MFNRTSLLGLCGVISKRVNRTASGAHKRNGPGEIEDAETVDVLLILRRRSDAVTSMRTDIALNRSSHEL